MHNVTRHAPRGMVASVDHLASAAGIAMLQRGGSAVDAAVAASAVLAVTTPHMCGMGGDLFALVHTEDEPTPAALNASGRAGSGADPEQLRLEGHDVMPMFGDLRSAPVPGCVDGWLALHDRFGRLPLGTVLEPAIGYAASGFPASPILSGMASQLRGVDGADDLVGHGPLHPGDLVRRPGVALELQAIASTGRAGFYAGRFAEGLLELGNGEYTPDDFVTPLADWVTPLCQHLWGHDVWTIPPNSQGYLTILGAAIAEGLPLPDDPDEGLWPHLLVEAARAAAYDRPGRLYEGADVTPLFVESEIDRRRALIDPDRRALIASPAGAGDTMYLCAVDQNRMGVSLIQSNAKGFGCNVFEPTTGIGLHNRGIGFSLQPGHPAEYGPGRRPPHTLAPALVANPDGSLRAVIGTMGGDAQPQILLQLLTRLLRHRQSAGAVIGAPRWSLLGAETGFDTWIDPDATRVAVETIAPNAWDEGLRTRGHDVVPIDGIMGTFGHAHVIEVDGDSLAGSADPRALIGSASGY
jgi:gamma-glutamyltranspeptidase/glutathione hydrolase